MEFTGVGCHKHAVKRALELANDKVLIVLCKTRDFTTIRERVAVKSFNYESPFEIDINEHINFIRNELNDDASTNFWISDNFKLIKVYMDDLNELRLNIELFKRTMV